MPTPGDREPMAPEFLRKMQAAVDAQQEGKRETLTAEPRPLTPEEEQIAREMMNEDGTMTRPAALAFVQHLAITHLQEQAVGFRAAAENVRIDPVGRADSSLIAELCEHVAESLIAANNAILSMQHAQQRRVQVAAPGGKLVAIPGSRLPQGGR